MRSQTSAACNAAKRCRKHQRKIPQVPGDFGTDFEPKPALKLFNTHLFAFAHKASQGCFDLFGVDVMVDRAGHPWLLEVNSNPALWDTPGVLAQVARACFIFAPFLYLFFLRVFFLLLTAVCLQVIPEVVNECVDIMLELQSPDANARSPAAMKTFELLAHSLP
jgi:hypothetical protein